MVRKMANVMNTVHERYIKENVSRVSLDSADGSKNVRSSKQNVTVPVSYAEPSIPKKLQKGDCV